MDHKTRPFQNVPSPLLTKLIKTNPKLPPVQGPTQEYRQRSDKVSSSRPRTRQSKIWTTPKDRKPLKSKRKPIPRLRRRPQDKTYQDEEIKTGTTRVTRLEPKTSPAYDKIAKIRRPRKMTTPKTPEDTNYYDEVYEIQERRRL
ncbi:hypothetical protein C2G38_2151655 [Gigaspora rosea]|uniref:Uncharacterized protein n=1 Tax=Gigaspora rosea TaxID=44941 RepID=A0A397W812_9GLOM|nr:hypothetical protein C2G38_2151655 [Gigaspora rosea]